MKDKNKGEALEDLVLFSNRQGTPIDIMSPTGALLENMMIDMQNNGNMAEVQFALERSDQIIEKYRSSFWRYHLLLPGPKIFIKAIESQFSEEDNIRPLLKAFTYDRVEIRLSTYLYILSLCLFLTSIAAIPSALIWQLYWLLIIPFVLFCVAWIQVLWFRTIINESCFVPLYTMIRDAILRRITAQQQFIEDTLGLRETVYKKYQEFEKEKEFNRLDANIQEEYKLLELKSVERLQGLAATVAIFQANNDEEINKLRNQTNLDYIKAELNIRNETEGLHQIAMAEIDACSKILVAQAEILGRDSQAESDMQRDIQRNLSLLRDWKSSFSNKRNKGFPDTADSIKAAVKKKTVSYDAV
jgi:hypothetical protein